MIMDSDEWITADEKDAYHQGVSKLNPSKIGCAIQAFVAGMVACATWVLFCAMCVGAFRVMVGR